MADDDLQQQVANLRELTLTLSELLHDALCRIAALHSLLAEPVIGAEEFQKTFAHLRGLLEKQRAEALETAQMRRLREALEKYRGPRH